MDENARQICERAFAAIDAVDAMKAERQAARQAETDEQRFARENREADAYLANLAECRRLAQAEPESRLIFKQYEPTTESGMTGIDRAWVAQQFEAFADMLGAEVAEADNKVIKAMRQEIGALRSEVDALRKANKPDVSIAGSVTSLRGRHVA